jgi:hypothetical protein
MTESELKALLDLVLGSDGNALLASRFYLLPVSDFGGVRLSGVEAILSDPELV